MSEKIDLRNRAWYAEWIANARLNGLLVPPIRSVHDLINELDDRKDLIVCGSGPTLDDDLAKLATDPSIIVANHSNLATLLFYNVRPDYVMITDAGRATYDRLANDVLPHYDMSFIKFILPTHANPKVVSLLRSFSIEPYFFINIARSIVQTEEQDRYNDILQVMTPSLAYVVDDDEAKFPSMVQCGCVSNAAVIFALFLAMNGQPLERVFLSGVDFSFPNGRNRCTTVTWSEGCRVEINPPRHPNDPPLQKIAGLATDAVQFAYYNDLKYIVGELNAMRPKPFEVFTTTNNFISDFLEVKGL